MKKYGLIGHPLTHSFSKKYFDQKFLMENRSDSIYELYDIIKIDELKQVLSNNRELVGLNVTIPYKELVMDYLDEIDGVAQKIGAVNTIKICKLSGKLKGYNTDHFGFAQSLKPFLNNQHERALILGTGGAAKAVKHVLNDLNIPFLSVSRSPQNDSEISYEDINEHVIKYHQLIINTTPLGTFPKVDEKPNLPYECINKVHLLYDLVYNPEVTAFLQEGLNRNAKTINGYQMLVMQAEKAWEIWNAD